MSAEADFWAAFEYDADTDRWLIARTLSPLDLLEIVAAKTVADYEAIEQSLGCRICGNPIDDDGDCTGECDHTRLAQAKHVRDAQAST